MKDTPYLKGKQSAINYLLTNNFTAVQNRLSQLGKPVRSEYEAFHVIMDLNDADLVSIFSIPYNNEAPNETGGMNIGNVPVLIAIAARNGINVVRPVLAARTNAPDGTGYEVMDDSGSTSGSSGSDSSGQWAAVIGQTISGIFQAIGNNNSTSNSGGVDITPQVQADIAAYQASHPTAAAIAAQQAEATKADAEAKKQTQTNWIIGGIVILVLAAITFAIIKTIKSNKKTN